MSRFGDYEGDDAGYNNSGELWWANVERQFQGRKGRELLRELIASLEAMPVKALVHGVLCDGKNVCAVGAVLVDRRVKAGEDRARVLADLGESDGKCICGHGPATHPGAPGSPDRPAVCTRCKRAHAKLVAKVGAAMAWMSCHGYEPEGDDWQTAQAAKAAGLPHLAAYRIEYHNDEEASELLTPEQRYEETLSWARRMLAKLEASPLRRAPRRERKPRQRKAAARAEPRLSTPPGQTSWLQ